MSYLLICEKVALRTTTPADIPFVLQTESHPENVDYVSQWAREKHLKALEDPNIKHMIVEDHQEDRVGYVILTGVGDWVNKCVELTRIVIAPKDLGYGTASLKLVIKYVFHELQFHRLWLDVLETNTRAQHIYHKVGFEKEGLLREADFYKGTYQNLVIMAILGDSLSKCK